MATGRSETAVRAAHLLRLEGHLDGRALHDAVDRVREVVLRPHDALCSAVHVDLRAVDRLAPEGATALRDLRAEAIAHHVVLTAEACLGSQPLRVLEFHRGLGLALPPVTTDRLG
jgi:hypothetical protein